MPYSFGKPALNCCGGSFSTLGNMNRPVAASAAADAAENAPHARPIHARRVSSGDVSSGSRPGAAVAVFAAGAGRTAAAPPADATVVVLPARSGTAAAGGLGAGAGRAACAPGWTGGAPVAAAAAAVVGADVSGVLACAGLTCGVAAGLAPVGGALGFCGLVSSAMSCF